MISMKRSHPFLTQMAALLNIYYNNTVYIHLWVSSSSEGGGMLIMLYGQVYDSKRSNQKYTPPGGQLHCSCTVLQ